MFVNSISYIPACMHTYIHTYARAYMRTYLLTNIRLNPNTYEGASKHTNMGICTYARTHAYIDSDTHRTYSQTHKIQTYHRHTPKNHLNKKHVLFYTSCDVLTRRKMKNMICNSLTPLPPHFPSLPSLPNTSKHSNMLQMGRNRHFCPFECCSKKYHSVHLLAMSGQTCRCVCIYTRIYIYIYTYHYDKKKIQKTYHSVHLLAMSGQTCRCVYIYIHIYIYI